MTTATDINVQLTELGTLADNKDQAPMRVGAQLIESFFDSFDGKHDAESTANVLYYLTDIQVRDYALGLLDPAKADQFMPALNHLIDNAPVDSIYMNAPVCLLATLHYELYNTAAAHLILSTASENYSLAQLLRRVFMAQWEPKEFAVMRAELHPKVVEGIFGEGN
jgi:hypothetical protein